MRAKFHQTLAFSTLFLIMTAGNSIAQSSDSNSQSAEEIANSFEKQKTRGLVLAPSNAGEDAEVVNNTTVAPIEIADIPKEEQVNINISFDFDSAVLRDDQKPNLTNLCLAMKSVAVDVFKIIGHTDSSGSESYNDQLSLLRAQEVKRFMVNDCGIASDRLEAVGVGERYPFNETDGRSDENRRVEFQVVS